MRRARGSVKFASRTKASCQRTNEKKGFIIRSGGRCPRVVLFYVTWIWPRVGGLGNAAVDTCRVNMRGEICRRQMAGSSSGVRSHMKSAPKYEGFVGEEYLPFSIAQLPSLR